MSEALFLFQLHPLIFLVSGHSSNLLANLCFHHHHQSEIKCSINVDAPLVASTASCLFQSHSTSSAHLPLATSICLCGSSQRPSGCVCSVNAIRFHSGLWLCHWMMNCHLILRWRAAGFHPTTIVFYSPLLKNMLPPPGFTCWPGDELCLVSSKHDTMNSQQRLEPLGH